jgi:hypothetical protein
MLPCVGRKFDSSNAWIALHALPVQEGINEGRSAGSLPALCLRLVGVQYQGEVESQEVNGGLVRGGVAGGEVGMAGLRPTWGGTRTIDKR